MSDQSIHTMKSDDNSNVSYHYLKPIPSLLFATLLIGCGIFFEAKTGILLSSALIGLGGICLIIFVFQIISICKKAKSGSQRKKELVLSKPIKETTSQDTQLSPSQATSKSQIVSQNSSSSSTSTSSTTSSSTPSLESAAIIGTSITPTVSTPTHPLSSSSSSPISTSSPASSSTPSLESPIIGTSSITPAISTPMHPLSSSSSSPTSTSSHTCDRSSFSSELLTVSTPPHLRNIPGFPRNFLPICEMHINNSEEYAYLKKSLGSEKDELKLFFIDAEQLICFEECPYSLTRYIHSFRPDLLKFFFVNPNIQLTKSDNWIFYPNSKNHPYVRGNVFAWKQDLPMLTQTSAFLLSPEKVPASEFKIPKPITLTKSIPESLLLWMKEVFLKRNYQGLLIGELHTQILARQILLNSMPFFKEELGITTIALEGLIDIYQDDLDKFLLTGKLTKRLRASLTDEFALILLQETQKYGIRLLALDTIISFNAPQDTNSQNRITEMSLTGKLIIEKELGHHDRMIVLCGRAHAATTVSLTTDTPKISLGLGDLLKIPVLLISHNSTPSLRFNVFEYELLRHMSFNVDAILEMRPELYEEYLYNKYISSTPSAMSAPSLSSLPSSSTPSPISSNTASSGSSAIGASSTTSI